MMEIAVYYTAIQEEDPPAYSKSHYISLPILPALDDILDIPDYRGVVTHREIEVGRQGSYLLRVFLDGAEELYEVEKYGGHNRS